MAYDICIMCGSRKFCKKRGGVGFRRIVLFVSWEMVGVQGKNIYLDNLTSLDYPCGLISDPSTTPL